LFLYNTIATKSVKKAYDALLLDAGGTLLQLTKPIEETYASIRRKYVFSSSSFYAITPIIYVGDNMLFMD
jgi:hypothetical protein